MINYHNNIKNFGETVNMVEFLKKYDVVLYILGAFLFSLACRYIWVYQFSGYEAFYWNHQLMINTNDGYYFATIVKDMLQGTNPENQLFKTALETYPGTIYSIYYLAKILPFSLDTIILYAPAFISSLIVIPIILIMRLANLTFIGFLAALLASITWSFYNRTMVGYFDTDMYALLFPVFILYFMMKALYRENLFNILIAAIVTSFYVVFYPQGYAAITALFVAYILYGFVFIKEKKEFYLSLVLLSVALIKIMLIVKLVLFIVLFLVAKKTDTLVQQKQALIVAIVSLVGFVFAGDGYSLILSKISWYTTTGVETGTLHFYDVAQTIREAGKIPFETFANRISGSILTFIIALAGYILLVVKKKEFLLFLPLMAIGFFAYIGGLRFTVYAIPAMAIGAVYLVYFIVDKIIVKDIPKNIVLLLATGIFLYPNITHIVAYKVPTVFNNSEVKVLDKLKNIATPKDYTLTWWDYGYPIWYYSETNTLIDGGKHHHDNYIIAKILTTSSQREAANLARVSVEKYVEKNLGYTPVANFIFKDNNKTLDPSLVLEEMQLPDYKLPPKTRDIYLYLPNRMLNIFPTVNVFANLDLKTGKKYPNDFFYQTQHFQQNGSSIALGNNITLLLDKGSIKIGGQTVKLHSFAVTEYDSSGKLHVKNQTLNPNAPISVIFMKNYNKFLVLDNKMYNSLYIQMFVLENYDHELFESVILSPLVKVYKLKV